MAVAQIIAIKIECLDTKTDFFLSTGAPVLTHPHIEWFKSFQL